MNASLTHIPIWQCPTQRHTGCEIEGKIICSLMGFEVQPVTYVLKQDYRIKLEDSKLTTRCFDSCGCFFKSNMNLKS